MSAPIADLVFQGDLRLEDTRHILHESIVFDIGRKAVDSSANILRQDMENVGDPRREFADAQIAVEEDRADIDALQQVVHVAGQLCQLRDLALMFRVDGVQLFVDRVQFLVGTLEFLV